VVPPPECGHIGNTLRVSWVAITDVRTRPCVLPSLMPKTQVRCAPTCARLCAPDVLGAVYAAHAREIIGYGQRMLGDRGLAEEVAQDVFVKAWRHCAGFDDTASGMLRTWLFAIARNAIIDAVRARSRRPPVTVFDADANQADPNDEFARLNTAWQVDDALRTIGPEYREVLTTVYLRERTYAHTAHSLRIPLGTVKSRVHNGLKSLRATLGSPQ
jgi:RNA polymerase sigma-70 factor, ECF subfamily